MGFGFLIKEGGKNAGKRSTIMVPMASLNMTSRFSWKEEKGETKKKERLSGKPPAQEWIYNRAQPFFRTVVVEGLITARMASSKTACTRGEINK
jgi:hypothetical protein